MLAPRAGVEALARDHRPDTSSQLAVLKIHSNSTEPLEATPSCEPADTPLHAALHSEHSKEQSRRCIPAVASCRDASHAVRSPPGHDKSLKLKHAYSVPAVSKSVLPPTQIGVKTGPPVQSRSHARRRAPAHSGPGVGRTRRPPDSSAAAMTRHRIGRAALCMTRTSIRPLCTPNTPRRTEHRGAETEYRRDGFLGISRWIKETFALRPKTIFGKRKFESTAPGFTSSDPANSLSRLWLSENNVVIFVITKYLITCAMQPCYGRLWSQYC